MSAAISGFPAEVKPSFATGSSPWEMALEHRIGLATRRHLEHGNIPSAYGVREPVSPAPTSVKHSVRSADLSEPSAIISFPAPRSGSLTAAAPHAAYRQAVNTARRNKLPAHKQVPEIHEEDSGFADRLLIDPRDHGTAARNLVEAVLCEGLSQQMALVRFKDTQPVAQHMHSSGPVIAKARPARKIALTPSSPSKAASVTQASLTRALVSLIDRSSGEYVPRTVAPVDTPAVAIIMDEVRKIFLSANLRAIRFSAPKPTAAPSSSLYAMRVGGVAPLRSASIARTALTA